MAHRLASAIKAPSWGASGALQGNGKGALLGLLAVGAVTEILIIVLVVQPLSLLAHPGRIDVLPMRILLGDDTGGVGKFVAVATIAIGLYLLAYVFSVQCRGSAALTIILAFSALFAVTLLFAYPPATPDIFHYILDGRMAWLDGLNPMILPPTAAASDPFFSYLTCCTQYTSLYGPAWQLLLFIPTHLAGDDFVANVIAFRAISVPFLLGSAYLAARIAEARGSKLAPAAALLVGWSPLLLFEIAANGHSDMVMSAFALFAFERAQRKRWTATLPLLTVSILAKYITLILVPLLLIAAWRSDGRRALAPMVRGALLSAGLALLLVAPLWSGPSTLSQILANYRASQVVSDFAWSSAQLLSILLYAIQPLPGQLSAPAAGELAKLITLALFAAAYAAILVRHWLGRDDLLTSAVYSLFFYLVLASWWFSPWYLCPVIILASGLLPARTAKLALILSTAPLFAEALPSWYSVMFNSAIAIPGLMAFVGIVFGPALTYWLAGLPRPGWMAAAFGEGGAP